MIQNLEKKTAGEAMQATHELGQCAAFTGWYQTELTRLANVIADDILHTDMSHEARENLRQRRLQLLEIIQLPANARQSAEGVLRHYPEN